MTYLSDTVRVILATAAQREDLSVLPFPDGVKAKGGAEKKVLAGLRKRGFIRVIETPGRPQRIVLTSEGMAAIGVEPDEEGAPTLPAPADDNAALDNYPTHGTPADQGAWAARRDDRERDRQVAAQAAHAARTPAEAKTKSTKAKAKATKPSKAAPAEKPTPRAGTKQALMIEMLQRPEGATVEQIAKATGWQHHTIRGAISGALKKKLGLTVEATRTREVGPNKPGAKGSATVYRIPGPAAGPQPSNGSGTAIA